MHPPEYTLDHAAELLDLRVDELLAAAECGKITLVYIIHRDTHAPYVPLDNAPEVAIRGFASEYFDEDGKKQYEHIPDARLRILVDADLIHRIRAGERVCRNMGFIYGKPNRNMVWFGRPVDITLDNLRVPAEGLEDIHCEISEKRDSLPSPASKRKQPPRKETIAKVVDRGKTLVQNGLMPEFETVWSSIKVMAPTGTQYRAESNLIETPEGETLTEANARRAYEKHRSNPH